MPWPWQRDPDLERRQEAVRQRVRRLSANEQQQFHARCQEALRDPQTYAATNAVFIGGLHHFYLGRWRRGLIDLALLLTAILLFLTGQPLPGTLALAALVVLELPYLFFAPRIVERFNTERKEAILDRIERPGRG